MNKALNDLLMNAAAKALKGKLEDVTPKTAIKKADPGKSYSDYDLSLGEFYIPGHTRRESATEEQKMIAGLKLIAQRLQKENAEMRNLFTSEKEKAFKAGEAQGHAKGTEEGYKKGQADMQAAVGKVQAGIASMLKNFEARKDEVLNRSERKSLEIIFQAVERILRREAETNRETVLPILKAAVTEVSRADTLIVKVNPADVEIVNHCKDFWLPVNAQVRELKVEEDARVERGGCLLESPSGSVDARLSTQLEKIREIFLKCWEEGMGSVM
jgi:flagellar assembly protein FliH